MFQHLKNPKILTAMSYDIIVSVLAFILAISLRFETINLEEVPISNLGIYFVILVCSQTLFFNILGLYRGMWRFSSTTDLVRILKATVYGSSVALGVIFFWNRLEGFPRSVFVIDFVLLVLGLGGGRFLYRLWKDSKEKKVIIKKRLNREMSQVLIVGAGSAGSQLVRDIQLNPDMGLSVSGFIDDDKSKKGRTIRGIQILGTSSELPTLIEKYNVSKVFLAIPSSTGAELKSIIDSCKDIDVEFKTLPKINEILNGKVELSLLRNINLEDLLGRDPIKLDHSVLGKMVNDKVVMVSGAGGSIGSELCNQISFLKPRKVILFEICELFLYKLEMSLKNKFPDIEFIPCIGDVRFKDRVEAVIKAYRPQVILHAAAYKHVPMMEANPLEAVFTNVLGTKVIADLASEYAVEKFVMISTDKAVNPTNIMGSTKRIAEMICQNLSSKGSSTQYITVRFGNVLGSNGSVIPLFKEQIEKGGPITVTHKDITRYFMSIPEACQLVLQAASMGSGGEIFVLDMGTPVKIVNLAKDLISLSGLKEGQDIKIEYTGLRPGEKLYEELFSDDEDLLPTTHEKVRKATCRPISNEFEYSINELLSLKNSSKREEFYFKIKNIVSEFNFSLAQEEDIN